MNPLQNSEHGLVKVQAIHTGDSISTGMTGNLVDFLLAHINNPAKPVLQRVIIVGHFTALGEGIAGIKHTDDASHHLFFNVVYRNHTLIFIAQIINRLIYPGPGQFEHGRNFFIANAKLTRNRSNVAKILCYVAPAGSPLGNLVGTGAAFIQGCLIKLIFFGHKIAFREPGHGERTPVVASFTHYQQLSRPNCWCKMRKGALERFCPTNYGDFIL